MPKPIKKYSPIDIDSLRKIRGYSLSMMRRGLDKIPDKAGIYIWRYWPSLVDIEVSKFMETLKRWKETQPQFEESVKNSRITVSVKRTPFGVSGDKINMFGLGMSHGKAKSLEEAIGNDSDIRQLLAYTLETLLSSTPPLYIGKADNLRSRLNDHFEGRSSSLISNIKQAGLPIEDIYISFIEDPVSSTDLNVTEVFEEIIQRVTNPPLTKRFG